MGYTAQNVVWVLANMINPDQTEQGRRPPPYEGEPMIAFITACL